MVMTELDNSKKLELLEWFAARCGDVIQEDYETLYLELARLLGAGDECETIDDVIQYMNTLSE